jgi:uncharacterized protein (DUF2225 family)
MTFLLQIKLLCPVCDASFESLVAKVTKLPGGRRSDLREEASGKHALPYLVHVCSGCGYAGQADQFSSSVDIGPEVRERIWVELRPRLATASGRTPEVPASEKYEAAAKIAEWQHADARRIADLWLRAAWCCEDENDIEAERYFRRKAAWGFEDALAALEGIAPDERATITYLIGELWRRIGDDWQANQWFARVPDEIVDFQAQGLFLAMARRQAEQPEERLP